jgi:hypothetical protein
MNTTQTLRPTFADLARAVENDMWSNVVKHFDVEEAGPSRGGSTRFIKALTRFTRADGTLWLTIEFDLWEGTYQSRGSMDIGVRQIPRN